jgi:hypothetical protein
VKTNLTAVWQKEVGVKINKFRIRKPSDKSKLKWNEYGTLVIREHRQILLDVYNSLLSLLVKEILAERDKNLAIDFICGVMEGNGGPSAKGRGHIVISTNEKDVSILESVLKIIPINFKFTKESKNKYSLRIGALEILKNFSYLGDKIFILYPKRRKALFQRLKTVKTVKFLIENYYPTSGIKSWLKNNGFCNENYKITEKRVEIKKQSNFIKVLIF